MPQTTSACWACSAAAPERLARKPCAGSGGTRHSARYAGPAGNPGSARALVAAAVAGRGYGVRWLTNQSRASAATASRVPGSSNRWLAPGTGQSAGPVHSRVSSQPTDGPAAAWLASRVMWRTSAPIVTMAWATGWPAVIACASGRGLTVAGSAPLASAYRVPPSPSECAWPFIFATNAPCEPASQPASRAAMLFPDGITGTG